MELPNELKIEIEKRLEKIDIKKLQENAENISVKYRTESGKGKRLVTEEIEALSYAAVRMPATYGAVSTVIEKLKQIYPIENLKTLLDVGAGTGAGAWAINEYIDLERINCLEREKQMRNLGKSLMQTIGVHNGLQKAIWSEIDLNNDIVEYKADIVLASYVLNEMTKEDYLNALNKLWNATNKILIIIEPGTPVGFREIKTIRDVLINKGGYVIAPCLHMKECMLLENDWCHATCRIARTKIHKYLKNANVPYEDEKFSYIVIAKEEVITPDNLIGRILRHPKIESGKITLDVCTNEGKILQKVVTKKDKELFKIVRKTNCGDLI